MMAVRLPPLGLGLTPARQGGALPGHPEGLVIPPGDTLTVGAVGHCRGLSPPRLLNLTATTPSLRAEGVQGIGGTGPDFPTPVGATVPSSLRLGLVVARTHAWFQVCSPVPLGTATLLPDLTYRITPNGAGGLAITDAAGEFVAATPSPLQIPASPDGPLTIQGKHYRGAMDVFLSPGQPDKLTVVNEVGLEDYLKGVLPAEMSTGWPATALKVQAVAARTYAAANMGRRKELGFDLYPTVADQVYGGMDIEAADTTAAVDSTRGEVMTYQGNLINALFFSSSGGSTDEAKAVWDVDLPYIQAKPDPDASPNVAWQATLTRDKIRQVLAALDTDIGMPTGMRVSQRTPGGRARWLKVTGDKGSALVDANRFRLAAGLKSTKYQLSRTRTGWQFDGSGYGHGLGMSQWGAKARAESGDDYRDILRYYYTGVEVVGPPS